MKTKIIPFDLGMAKDIQAGEIKGAIKTKCGNEVRILCFDLIDSKDVSFPIVCALYNDKNVRIARYTKYGRYSGAINSELDLILEVLDDELQNPQFNLHYSIEQLDKLKEYTKQLIEVNQGVIDNLSSMIQELRKTCNLSLKTEFKPFDKVLVRRPNLVDPHDIYGQNEWVPTLFQGMSDCYFIAEHKEWEECIPYEGNEYLLGTTNKPNEN